MDTDGVSKEEFLKDFFKTFKAEKANIRDALASVNGEVHEQLDGLLLRLQELEASFTRQAHVLPAYDVQQYRSILKGLTSDLATRREQLAPRKKFSFKRRNPPGPGLSESESKGYTTSTSSDLPKDPNAAFHGERLDDLENELIIRKPGDLQGRDVWLSHLRGCRVVFLDRIGALHVHHLKQCEVVVSSSAMLHHCENCIFTLAVKQLRLHDSQTVALHLHTLSGPIIEHCQRVAFAPIDLHCPEGARLLQEASLGETAEGGAWSEVQDFNWLKRQASPNWRLVPPALRRQGLELSEEVLRHFSQDTLPPALSFAEVKAAGLKPGKDFTGVGVGAFIFDEKGRVLLLKRSATARTAPGGAVNFGESCEAALLREIREETNLNICNPELLDVTSEPSSGAHWVSIGYTADLAPGCTASDARNMEPAKHDDIGFFHLEALPTPLADFTANAVPMLLEKWKRVLVLSIRERKFRSKSGPRNGSF
eukprot:g5204.t1